MKTKLARYVLDQCRKKKEVIPPVSRYERLLEDLHDLAALTDRLREDPISIQEMQRRLETKPLPTGRRW
jgi:hypothetical protein